MQAQMEAVKNTFSLGPEMTPVVPDQHNSETVPKPTVSRDGPTSVGTHAAL